VLDMVRVAWQHVRGRRAPTDTEAAYVRTQLA
jgi:hypothetical protein